MTIPLQQYNKAESLEINVIISGKQNEIYMQMINGSTETKYIIVLDLIPLSFNFSSDDKLTIKLNNNYRHFQRDILSY